MAQPAAKCPVNGKEVCKQETPEEREVSQAAWSSLAFRQAPACRVFDKMETGRAFRFRSRAQRAGEAGASLAAAFSRASSSSDWITNPELGSIQTR